jgi:hypothetical protein
MWHALDAPRLTGLHVRGTRNPSQAPTNVRRDRRLTAPFSGRPLTTQHAGAHDLFKHSLSSPAAKHFIQPGPLQRFVRWHYATS